MQYLHEKLLSLKFETIKLVLFCTVLNCFSSVSQQNLIPIHSFYKDHLFANKGHESYNEGSFFPVNESKYDLIPIINDSSKQYYKFTEVLFKKYLVEVKGKDFYIKLSPAIDFSIGRDISLFLHPCTKTKDDLPTMKQPIILHWESCILETQYTEGKMP